MPAGFTDAGDNTEHIFHRHGQVGLTVSFDFGEVDDGVGFGGDAGDFDFFEGGFAGHFHCIGFEVYPLNIHFPA